MKKFKLHSIGNDGNFNYYLFDKKQDILIKLSKIFRKVLETCPIRFYEEYQDKKGKWKTREINYEKKKDWHESVHGKKARVDIYFGDKKMWVLVHCSYKLILKVNQALPLLTYNSKTKKWK